MSLDQDIERAQRQLRMLDRNISLSLPEAVEALGEFMVDRAKEKARRDTGKMAEGTKHRAGDSTPNSAQRVVFNDVFYARFHEYGTRKMSKHPFMRPAFDETQGKLDEIAGRIVKAKDGV